MAITQTAIEGITQVDQHLVYYVTKVWPCIEDNHECKHSR